MRKFFLLSLLFVFISFKSNAQYSYTTGSFMFGSISYDTVNGTASVTAIDDGMNSGYYETCLYVWATGNLGDEVDLIAVGGNNQQSSASGSYDPATAFAGFPSNESWTLHYAWSVSLNDGNWCTEEF